MRLAGRVATMASALAAVSVVALGVAPVAGVSAAKPKSSLSLTLYSSQGYDSDTANLFQAQTGVKVNLVDDSTGPLVARITAERNNPRWDVVWFDGSVTMLGLDRRGT